MNIDRRSFLRSTSAALAAPFAAPLLSLFDTPARAQLATTLGEKVAASIAQQVGEAVVRSGLNSLGLGGIASFFGGGGSSDTAILDKLNQIKSQLDDILHSIDALHQDLAKRFDVLQFNQLVTGIGASALIQANHTLNTDYTRLINAALRHEHDLSGYITQINYDMQAIYGGPDKWNDIMTGGSGAMSLIPAAQGLAASSNQLSYTAESARNFENLWSYFDSQQTVTLFYFMEHLSATGQGGSHLEVLNEWCENRKKQVGMLRGTASRSTYLFNVYSQVHPGHVRPFRSNVPLPFLPEDTVLQRHLMPDNRRALWYLKIHPPVPQGSGILVKDCTQTNNQEGVTKDDTRAAFVKVASDADNSVGSATGSNPSKTTWSGWSIPLESWLGQLIHDCGDRVASLGNFGFDFPADDLRLWATPDSDTHGYHQLRCETSGVCHHLGYCDHSGNDHMQRDFLGYVSYNKDGSISTPAENPDDAAMIVYCRRVSADQFLYT